MGWVVSNLFVRRAGKIGLGLYGLSAAFAVAAIAAVVYSRVYSGGLSVALSFACFGAMALMQAIYKSAGRSCP
jgi:hypothetical protein